MASGASCSTSGVPSIPLAPGMTTSITTTSGFCARASKTASRTLPASATTSMSSSASSTRRRPGAHDGVVVDEDDADHRQRDLGDDRRSPVRRRLDGEAAVEERDPLAHPDDAEAAVAGLVRREADAVVLDHRGDRVALAGHEHAHPRGPGVLDHVRQRLLDDPVEGGLDRRRQPFLAQHRLELDRDRGLLGEGLGQALERGHEPEVVERLRAELDGEAPHVVERLDEQRAQARRRLARPGLVLGLLDRPQAEQHRGERLAGLVVQLARQPAPLELLRVDDARDRVARDPRREVGRDRGARGEGLGEAQVLLREAGVRAALVVGDDDADRLAASRAGGRRGRSRRRALRVTPWATSGSSSSESTRSLRPRSTTFALFELTGSSSPTSASAPSPGRGPHDQPVAARQRDEDVAPRRAGRARGRRRARGRAAARSRSRARSRPRSATRGGATSASPTRTAARSRSRPRPARRAA